MLTSGLPRICSPREHTISIFENRARIQRKLNTRFLIAQAVATYNCECEPGWANGKCKPGYIVEYLAECSVLEGTCDVDINECASRPCQNEATCSESTTNPNVPIDAFACACVVGWANGICNYNTTVPNYPPALCRVVAQGQLNRPAGEGTCA